MTDRSELVDDLLGRTSRTFALAIPLLPEPLRREVSVGYLLFRIADTLEDAERLSPADRRAELGEFMMLIMDPTEAAAQRLAARWKRRPPSESRDYNDLLAQTPAVLAELVGLGEAPADIVKRHLLKSSMGMAQTLMRADAAGGLRLKSLNELLRYCYCVAGIVGEMLTDLFILGLAPSSAREALAADAAAFGEGLQLVNILKDRDRDAQDGRVYLPEGLSNSAVIAQARQDLAAAKRYAENLEAAGAEPGVVAFATLPRTLAEETLSVIERGEGVKVTRDVVAAKLAEARAVAGRAL